MKLLYALIAVLAIAAVGLLPAGVPASQALLGIVVPYAAIAVFLVGLAWRVVTWARTPVPFRIPATCGQQKSLPWIKTARLDNPSTTLGVVGRMALEILLFRSLFRNTQSELREGPRLAYGEEKLLWMAALAFHWSFLIVFVRHLRFFLEPIPAFVLGLGAVDGFFQVGTPELYLTDVALLAGVLYLLVRRLGNPRVRYISLFTDYFALLLIAGLALSGVLMRYFLRVDLRAVKQLAIGLVTFHPVAPAGIGAVFFVHLTLLSALLAYFPFSKLVHMGGIFLSPTRNLANNNRMKRHINPWNYPVKVHTYEEWEEEFHDKIVAAGLPLDKE
jgi:nitrate reductase gamma subunit